MKKLMILMIMMFIFYRVHPFLNASYTAYFNLMNRLATANYQTTTCEATKNVTLGKLTKNCVWWDKKAPGTTIILENAMNSVNKNTQALMLLDGYLTMFEETIGI